MKNEGELEMRRGMQASHLVGGGAKFVEETLPDGEQIRNRLEVTGEQVEIAKAEMEIDQLSEALKGKLSKSELYTIALLLGTALDSRERSPNPNNLLSASAGPEKLRVALLKASE